MIPIEYMYPIVLFLFGLTTGSFLNVVVGRLPWGLSVIHPPSMCPGCGRHLHWYENIPVVSWAIQLGRCRGCKVRIHWRYPFVELLTGLVWAGIGYRFWNMPAPAVFPTMPDEAWVRIGTFVALLWFATWLIAIAFIDFDLTIIPDELSYSGILLALAASASLPHLHMDSANWFPAVGPHLNSLMASGAGALVGGGSMFLMLFVGTILFRKQIKALQEEDPEIDTAIGYGDVKLMLFLGAFLGWKEVLLAFLLGTLFGAVIGVVAKLRTGQSLIPYGPFLCAGALCVVFFRDELFALLAARLGGPAGGGALPPM